MLDVSVSQVVKEIDELWREYLAGNQTDMVFAWYTFLELFLCSLCVVLQTVSGQRDCFASFACFPIDIGANPQIFNQFVKYLQGIQRGEKNMDSGVSRSLARVTLVHFFDILRKFGQFSAFGMSRWRWPTTSDTEMKRQRIVAFTCWLNAWKIWCHRGSDTRSRWRTQRIGRRSFRRGWDTDPCQGPERSWIQRRWPCYHHVEVEEDWRKQGVVKTELKQHADVSLSKRPYAGSVIFSGEMGLGQRQCCQGCGLFGLHRRAQNAVWMSCFVDQWYPMRTSSSTDSGTRGKPTIHQSVNLVNSQSVNSIIWVPKGLTCDNSYWAVSGRSF